MLIFIFIFSVLIYSFPAEKFHSFNIGAILDPSIQLAQTFEVAVKSAELNGNLSYSIDDFVRHSPYDILESEKTLCELLEKGVIAVVGPSHSPSSEHIESILEMLDLPYLVTAPLPRQTKEMSLINFYPHPRSVSKAFADLIVIKEWIKFTILYEDAVGLSDLLEVLHLNNIDDKYEIRIRQLLPGEDFRPLLINVKKSGAVNFLVQCDAATLPDLLVQAQQVGIMSNKHSYIITSLDFHTIDLEPFSYGGANITGLRMYDPTEEAVIEFAAHLNSSMFIRVDSSNFTAIVPEKLNLNTLLIYDAVQVFSQALNSLYDVIVMYRDLFETLPISCEHGPTWSHGATILNQIRTTTTTGLTGLITFDDEGFRSDISLDLIELNVGGELVKVGNWTNEGFILNRTEVKKDEEKHTDSMKNETFTVIIAISPPYEMLKESTVKLEGNEQYEGFGIELLQEIGKLLEFNVTFELDTSGTYGSCNKTNKTCNGMLAQVINGNAEFAITDLTITEDREAVVDFTSPFLTLGISILYKKPEEQPPGLFTFMLPFSNGVWLCLGAAYILVSVLLYLLGRICPEEWQNPYPCIEDPEVLMNQFTFANALWFNAGAMLLQGSEIAPIAYGTRTIASMWWFFVLIITSSYTANLTASLAVRPKVIDFSNANELANNDLGIAYGAKIGGSTLNFFRDSENEDYRKMYEYMQEHPEHMVENNDQILEKVLGGHYAFLMESTSIEYVVERNCGVMQVGGLLDTKGYGIAMKKDSPYRDKMSQAVLKLQEQGKIESMKNRWWKEKRAGASCSDSSQGENDDLSLSNVGGVFVVLGVGTVIGCIMSFVDFLKAVKRQSVLYNVPFKEELKRELRIVFSLTTNEKPVQHRIDVNSHSESISLRSLDSYQNERDDNLAEMNITRSPRQSFRSGSRRRSSLHHPIHEGNVRLARQFTT